MPHIVIKSIGGASQEAAEQAVAVLSKAMGKPEKYFSVAVENYSFNEWESVFNEHIKDNDKVVVKPGYSDPVTFQ
jgi:phenylpyruvate tautomerase PptA (4-oxalocrotonate tautomerase family)